MDIHFYLQCLCYSDTITVEKFKYQNCFITQYLHLLPINKCTYDSNQCLLPLTLRWGVLDTTLCDKICQWLAAGQWFSPGTPVTSTNKTDSHDITEILLKVALNTIILTHIWQHTKKYYPIWMVLHSCIKSLGYLP